MKKKTVKKLVLAKETVRELAALPHVVGGVTNGGCSGEISASCWWTCACNSNVFACPITAGETCISC